MGDPQWFYKYLPIGDMALGDIAMTLNVGASGAQEAGDQEKAALYPPGANASVDIEARSLFVQGYGASEVHQTFWNRVRTQVNAFPDALQDTLGTSRLGPLSYCQDNETGNGYRSTTDGALTAGSSVLLTADDVMQWTSTDYVLIIDKTTTSKYEVATIVTSSATQCNVTTLANSYVDESRVYLLEWHAPNCWLSSSPTWMKDDSTTTRCEFSMTFQTADDIINGYSIA